MTPELEQLADDVSHKRDKEAKDKSYKDALAKVKSTKPKDNYLVIEVDNSLKIVLPYADGMVMLSALSNAEQLDERWGDPGRINPLDRTSIRTFVFSGTDYEYYKMAALLNISFDELSANMKEQPK